MLTIYHLENSRSERIIWLCEELGLRYKLEKFARTPERAAPPAYRALHPLARAPAIRDGDLILVESGAIIEYIITRHGRGKLRPKPRSAEYPYYLQWLHFAEGSALQHLIIVYLLDLAAPPGAPPNPMRERMRGRVSEEIGYMNAILAKQPYFAGKMFTGADINMVYAVNFYADGLKGDMAPYPHLAAYRARIAERPAYKKAMSLA